MIVKTSHYLPIKTQAKLLPINKIKFVYVLKHSMMSHLFSSEFVLLQKYIFFQIISNTFAFVNVDINVEMGKAGNICLLSNLLTGWYLFIGLFATYQSLIFSLIDFDLPSQERIYTNQVVMLLYNKTINKLIFSGWHDQSIPPYPQSNKDNRMLIKLTELPKIPHLKMKQLQGCYKHQQ